ncbi:MAG: dienelactone hydrolase family protein [Sorangiineae bacterium]|nr:dienelactone hydrolase family protein [Polyangiaceae bacterium]MEB2323276.1 dienelactone hydrolase family protein [Sorangiineae bacterium]
MMERDVELTLADGVVDAVLLAPEGEGPWPGILHYPDVMGVRPAQRDMARRLAGEGYLVLLPNLFFRTRRSPVFEFEPNFSEPRTLKRMGELRGPLTPEVMEADGSAYIDFLSEAGARPGPLGVVGYCFSGAMALRTAAARPERIAAAASFHGGHLVTEQPSSPHRVLPRVRARLYFAHASGDRSMPRSAIRELESALAGWGGAYESELYPGVSHGWTVPGSPAYERDAAERAYAKLVALFAATLRS